LENLLTDGPLLKSWQIGYSKKDKALDNNRCIKGNGPNAPKRTMILSFKYHVTLIRLL
jgi:hypothetical protein